MFIIVTYLGNFELEFFEMIEGKKVLPFNIALILACWNVSYPLGTSVTQFRWFVNYIDNFIPVS